jgi:hypothetical protein
VLFDPHALARHDWRMATALANCEHTDNDASEQRNDNPIDPSWLSALLPFAVRGAHATESTTHSTLPRDECVTVRFNWKNKPIGLGDKSYRDAAPRCALDCCTSP